MKKLVLVLSLVMAVAFIAGCSQSAAPAADAPGYADGTYRGAYFNPEDVEVEFVLKGGKFESIKFRQLGYKGEAYLKSEGAAQQGVVGQYQQLADYLVGKELSAIDDLYTPGEIATDTDTFTSATLRSGKMISAINDGLNRGLYKLPDA